MQPERELRLGGFSPPSNRQMAFLDVETTGLPRSTEEGIPMYGMIDVIDVAVIRDGLPWESKVRLTSFDEARADTNSRGKRTWREVTGYSTAEWASAPLASEMVVDLARQLHGATLVAHNAAYDLGVLESFLERHGIPWSSVYCGSSIDTYPLAKAMLGRRGLSKFSLDACCEFLGLEREGEHRAIGGATRCRQLFVELCRLAWRP